MIPQTGADRAEARLWEKAQANAAFYARAATAEPKRQVLRHAARKAEKATAAADRRAQVANRRKAKGV